MSKNLILQHLQNQNLDIRIRGKSPACRFMDQKVTPDILSVICSAICSLDDDFFTSRDIWDSVEFSFSMRDYFSKGSVDLDQFKHEYDKVIGQCLNTLNFSNIIILTGKKNRSNQFRIANKELLLFISTSDRNAYTFLSHYLIETLNQSNFLHYFDEFFSKQHITNDDYSELKEKFDLFLKNYSNISSNNFYETKRIFTKVLNPVAVFRHSYGTRSGRLSKDPITYSELLYNRTNWRDIGKPKGISRKEYRDNSNSNNEKIRKYSSKKAKDRIKDFHVIKSKDGKLKSEVPIDFDYEIVFHAHHIFPEYDYEELSDSLENIIIITAGQHYSLAHPNGTNSISREFQMKCLLYKLKTILNSEYSQLYDIIRFLDVLEVGLNLVFPNLNLSDPNLYQIISDGIVAHYNNNYFNR